METIWYVLAGVVTAGALFGLGWLRGYAAGVDDARPWATPPSSPPRASATDADRT